MEGDDFMIFLVVKAIAETMASHFARGATMLAGIIALLIIITVLIVRILHTKKAVSKVILSLLCILLLPQVFAMATFVEFKDRTIVPEQISAITDNTEVLEAMLVEGKGGFTLTDQPPKGTCTAGDYAIEQLDDSLLAQLRQNVEIDCSKYTYLFVQGEDQVSLNYTVWCNGLSWYLGSKGFYRSFEEAELRSPPTNPGNSDTIYVYRFPKEYIQLSSLGYASGYVKYFFITFLW